MNTKTKTFSFKFALQVCKEDIVHPKYVFSEIKGLSELNQMMNDIIDIEFSYFFGENSRIGANVKLFEESKTESGLNVFNFVSTIIGSTIDFSENEVIMVFENSIMDIVYFFESRGYRVVQDASAMGAWHQEDYTHEQFVDKISIDSNRGADIGFQTIMTSKTLEYVDFRDAEASLLEPDSDDSEDNTFRPRTNDEILGDLDNRWDYGDEDDDLEEDE